jgi:hypothetical protein
VTGTRSSLTFGISATALTVSCLRPLLAAHVPVLLLMPLERANRGACVASDARDVTVHLAERLAAAAGLRPWQTAAGTREVLRCAVVESCRNMPA